MPVVPTEEGYYVAGLYDDINIEGVVVFHLNLKGELLWSKIVDETNEDYYISGLQSGGKFIENSAGNLVLTYTVRNYDVENSIDNVFLELSKNAEQIKKVRPLSSPQYSEEVLSIIETSNSEYICVGHIDDSFNQLQYVYLIHLDENFDVIWEKEYALDGRAVAWNVIELPDGNFLVGAYAQVDGSNYDSWLLKIDEEGEILWDETFGGGGGKLCNGLIPQR